MSRPSSYPVIEHTDPSSQTRKDYISDQEVRWCPGCGDYSILAQVQRVMPSLGIPRENHVFISGIGCSSRFPYYMETYGIHSIHGRAPALATGLKAARPELTVWVITGDGDGLSIGGNHLMHVLRRNVDVKILMFNNQIYGLTKGQYSPTSPIGKRAKSTPAGSVDYPVDPVAIALGAGATFVARTLDVNVQHIQAILKRAAAHKGTAFVEIYQNCNIFNDGAFAQLTDKESKLDRTVELHHGEPLRFGKGEGKGIRLRADLSPEVVDIAADGEEGLLIYDETSELHAAILSRIGGPNLPTPIGVFRAVDHPSYEAMLQDQVDQASANNETTVQDLLEEGHWVVE